MKYCPNCGKANEDSASYCVNCGTKLSSDIGNSSRIFHDDLNFDDSYKNSATYRKQVKPDFMWSWGLLGFFFPLIGIILYIIWRKGEDYEKGRSAGIGALVSVGASVAFTIFYLIFALAFAGSFIA